MLKENTPKNKLKISEKNENTQNHYLYSNVRVFKVLLKHKRKKREEKSKTESPHKKVEIKRTKNLMI